MAKSKPKKHACGPDEDEQFFIDLQQVMKRYPRMAKKYHVVCADHETDIMKIRFEKQAAVSRIEGRIILTEFKERAELEGGKGGRICCKWCFDGVNWVCCGWWV